MAPVFDSSRRCKDPGSVVALEKEGLRVSFKLLEAAAPSHVSAEIPVLAC